MATSSKQNGSQQIIGNGAESAVPASSELPLTPDLVRQVTEKVYKLWLSDLQVERERLGNFRPFNRRRGAR